MIKVKKLNSFEDLSGFDFSSVNFFQAPEYLKVFIKHFCKAEDVIILGIYEGLDFRFHGNDMDWQGDDREEGGNDGVLVGYGCFENDDGTIKFLGMKKVLGEQEVTDYGDIVMNLEFRIHNSEVDREKIYSSAWEAIFNWFKESGFKKVELDYINYELRIKNLELRIEEQEVAPYLDLLESWEKYVESLEYKNRRELRRKINRLKKEKHEFYSFRCFETSKLSSEDLKQYFQEFVRLVKLSEQEKEKFMTREMEDFFCDLLNLKTAAWQIVLNFLQIDGKNAACILTFENGEDALGYNSGYDPEFLFYSPGFLAHAFKVKQLIENKFKKYDFLRGKERYKFDLGAKEKKLYKTTVLL